MKNAKKIVNVLFITIAAQKMFRLLRKTKLKLNFKPNSIIYLQKIKSLPEEMKNLSPFAIKNQVILVSKFAFQVTNALTKLINHNDLYNVNIKQVIVDSKDLKKMKHPHSSIFNNFSKIFGLINWVINYWSKNFVWFYWIVYSKKYLYFFRKNVSRIIMYLRKIIKK